MSTPTPFPFRRASARALMVTSLCERRLRVRTRRRNAMAVSHVNNGRPDLRGSGAYTVTPVTGNEVYCDGCLSVSRRARWSSYLLSDLTHRLRETWLRRGTCRTVR